MAVAKTQAELHRDIEEANAAKQPENQHVTTTQNVNQPSRDVARNTTGDDGRTPSGIPRVDMNGDPLDQQNTVMTKEEREQVKQS